MITINKQLDMTPGAIPVVIHRSQYDSDFSIVFTLFARTGDFTIASGTTAKVRGTKKSGTGYSADATIDISAKTVTVAGNQQMTVASGQNIFEIVLLSGTSELCSANFILDVERAALDMDTITDDTVLRELDNLEQFVEEAESAATRAEQAAASFATDTTLTVSGKPADAKAVGDAIASEDKKALAAFATDTASGAVASFPDGAGSIPMKDVLVHIEPVQAGSGNPSPDNIRPISGWTGAKVTKCGKNFLENTADSKVSAGITFRINSDKTVTVIGTATSSTNLNIAVGFKIPKGEYILSGCPNGGGSSTYEILAVYNGATYRDYGNGVLLKVVDDNPIQYVQVVVRNGYTANNLIFKPMIRYSDSDPTYEPYSGQTYDITFPTEAGTVYGGALDVTSGVLTVDRGIYTFTNATRQGVVNQSYYAFNHTARASLNVSTESYIAAVCTQYKCVRSSLERANGSFYLIGGDIVFVDDRFTSLSAANEIFASEHPTVVYPLATPITYQLTPQEITSLLGANNLWADTGNSEVEYRADAKMYVDNKIAELQALVLENNGGN